MQWPSINQKHWNELRHSTFVVICCCIVVAFVAHKWKWKPSTELRLSSKIDFRRWFLRFSRAITDSKTLKWAETFLICCFLLLHLSCTTRNKNIEMSWDMLPFLICEDNCQDYFCYCKTHFWRMFQVLRFVVGNNSFCTY